MEPQQRKTDWIDAELRELFDSAIADAERQIDVDERHRQWLVGSQLRSLDPGSSQTGERFGWRKRQSWPKLLSAGTVAAVAVAAVGLFSYQSDSQQVVVVGDDTEIINSPTAGIIQTPEPGVGNKSNVPTSQATTTPSSQRRSKPLVVTPTSQPRSTTVSTSSSTSSTRLPPTSPRPTTIRRPTSTVTPPTAGGSEPGPSFEGQPTTSSTTDSSTIPPGYMKPPNTTGPPIEATSSTTLTTTESMPSSTESTSTVTELKMGVSIEASDPSGTTVSGTKLESDLLISEVKSLYILPQQCQQVGLIAPPGYRFGGDGGTPETVTKLIEICPTDDDPSELTLFETVIELEE